MCSGTKLSRQNKTKLFEAKKIMCLSFSFFSRIRMITMMLFGICYALMPFDLIPESLLGVFGLIDDLVIIVFLLTQVSILFRTHMLIENEGDT